MTQAASERVQSIDELETVVDSDGHIREPLDELANYVDDPGMRTILEQTSNPKRDIFSSVHAFPYLQAELQEGGKGSIPSIHDPARGDTYTAQHKLDELDEFGITHTTLHPTLLLGITGVNNTQMATELAAACNAWVADTFLNESDRFFAAITIAPQDPEKSAAEIDKWATEDRWTEVYISGLGLIPPPGHKWYDPIYDAAQRHGLPVHFHSGSTRTAKGFPSQYWWSQTKAENHALSHPFGHQWNLTNMMFNGIPEKYPDLDFIFAEAGIGWVPYWMWRLDDHYLAYSNQVPALDKLPSEYIKDQFYFATQPIGHTGKNYKQYAQIIEMIGPDNIMYSSDLPHHDFDPPSEFFDVIRPHFDRDDVENMMGKTAERLIF